MTKHTSVKCKLHCEITNFMKSIEKWDEYLQNELPSSWEYYNGFIIFSSPSFKSHLWTDAGTGLWEIICRCLKAHSIAIKDKIKNDSFRSPQAFLVYGSSPIITYIDNRIKYSWDVEKTMFSAGNVTERHRIASLNCMNEVIVDLFAGIGYFTLPYLVHAGAKFVHACEWNPNAIESLRRNLDLNKVQDKCMVHEGDNRKVCPKKIAHRVNVGLIPSSEDYWETACGALLSTGGVIYIHQNITSKIHSENICCKSCDKLLKRVKYDINGMFEISKIIFSKEIDYKIQLATDSCLKWKYSEWFIFSIHISHVILDILEELHSKKWFVSVDEVIRVKSYAPHIDHLVYTVVCKT